MVRNVFNDLTNNILVQRISRVVERSFATNQYLKTPTNIQAKMNCWIHIEILQNARKTTEIRQ